MWHINNEYGCHLQTRLLRLRPRPPSGAGCEQRYGTVDALNEAWGTSFWSQRYGDFGEVLPPRQAPYSHNPSSCSTSRRFSSDALLECYLMEKRRSARPAASSRSPPTSWACSGRTDYWRWAAELDVIGDDAYPDPADPSPSAGGVAARPDALAEAGHAVDADGAGDQRGELAARQCQQGAGSDGGVERCRRWPAAPTR